jgi:hypothetical protein
MYKYKERCVKTDLYFILNYLYTHGDGKSKKKQKKKQHLMKCIILRIHTELHMLNDNNLNPPFKKQLNCEVT